MQLDTTNNTQINELVINWHITEVCNYNCVYCFAKWGRPNELHRSIDAIDKVLEELAVYFIRGNPKLKRVLGYSAVRLNFAGGEPMILGSVFSKILLLAKQKGFMASIITNGSYLLNQHLEIPENSIDMIGISFDSQFRNVRERLGRNDRKGNSLDAEQLRFILDKLVRTQKGLNIKINTVVNSLNWQEDFSPLMAELKPDKWKLLQVMPYGENELLISKDKFIQFVERHSNIDLPISPETNDAMTDSYLMIDPQGRFYQNQRGESGYKYSNSISDIGVESALKQISFNPDTFKSRYQKNTNLIALTEVK